MTDLSRTKIEPLKIFVRFIPFDTTADSQRTTAPNSDWTAPLNFSWRKDELRSLFGSCGNVRSINIVPPKNPDHYNLNGFVAFETQQEADRAVQEMNVKLFTNSKGYANKLLVVHSRFMEPRSSGESGKRQNSYNKHHKQLEEKTWQQLWEQYQSNEEKLKQIYHDPAIEQELKDLTMKMNQLQTKKDELEAKVSALRGEIEILNLRVQLQELNQEQVKLKSGN